jgi:hypothetical protein
MEAVVEGLVALLLCLVLATMCICAFASGMFAVRGVGKSSQVQETRSGKSSEPKA